MTRVLPGKGPFLTMQWRQEKPAGGAMPAALLHAGPAGSGVLGQEDCTVSSHGPHLATARLLFSFCCTGTVSSTR